MLKGIEHMHAQRLGAEQTQLADAQLAAAKPSPTDRHHQGFFGLREDDVVAENILNAEFNKQKICTHPVSAGSKKLPGRERFECSSIT